MSRWSLALSLLFVAPGAPHADPRLLVAQLSAPPGDARAATGVAANGEAALRRAQPRFAALGLLVRRTLLEGLPDPPLARGGLASRASALARVPSFAPERVVLLEAPDSALAEAARVTLGDDALIDWVEPLRTRHAEVVQLKPVPAPRTRASLLDSLPNDPLLRSGDQWGVYNIGPTGTFGGIARADVHALEAWGVSVGDDALKLAVADTGIDPAQPELGGLMPDGSPRIVDGINMTGEPVPAVTDSFGHGTPVAGVVAARTNDGPHFLGAGVAGICGGDGLANAGCHIVPIKIAPGHSGEASSFDIARAAMYAADDGCRAMNLSFAGEGASRLERLGLAYAIVRQCVVVVSAGNQGFNSPTLPQYPSAYAADGLCIQAGATDSFDQRVAFSSYGLGLDLMAPGVNVYTTFMTYPSWSGASYPGGYVAGSGTSFSSPFVTGAIGLLNAVRPELLDTDLQHVLRESAADIGAPGIDEETGYGRLDIGRALAAVHSGIGVWHDEVAADSFVAEAQGLLAIGERGPGTLDRLHGTYEATRIAAYATVTLPDSFVDSIRVWPRVGGTLAVRGDFELPYFSASAAVIAQQGRTFTLRGYVYRVNDDTCVACVDHYAPLSPEYVRFGFTVLGRVAGARPPALAEAPPRLALGPDPFRGELSVRAPAAGRVTVLDASGRLVRAFASGAGTLRWDGRDALGRAVPPGLYFVRWQGERATRLARVVRLAP